MREFKIKTKNAEAWLVKAGYKLYKSTYVLNDAQGRFHAQVFPTMFKVHYDLNVGRYHRVFELPIKLKEEKSRIRKLIPRRRFGKRDFKDCGPLFKVEGTCVLYKSPKAAERHACAQLIIYGDIKC